MKNNAAKFLYRIGIRCQVSAWQSTTVLPISCKSVERVPAWVESQSSSTLSLDALSQYQNVSYQHWHSPTNASAYSAAGGDKEHHVPCSKFDFELWPFSIWGILPTAWSHFKYATGHRHMFKHWRAGMTSSEMIHVQICRKCARPGKSQKLRANFLTTVVFGHVWIWYVVYTHRT